ncbi:MAG: GNAT family N-acetyltransferase [Sedimentisphaerales bacterium]|nr:GNAT family N-acetyltransferase [Sedimentisphaerales bacterium]
MENRPTFRIARSLDDLTKVFIVRGIVFMGEQQISYHEEMDAHEHAAIHLLGELDGEPIAAGRIRVTGTCAKLERLAVREPFRGRGYGDELVRFALDVARERGFRTFRLNAQITVRDFYARHGFRVCGENFLEASIEHCPMLRED